MPDDRYARGEKLLREVDGDRVADNLIADYADLAPAFTRYLIEFAFGEIYARPGDLKQRELVAIATLATMGDCDKQLGTHVRGALRVGLGEAEIVEAVMTLIPYIGFPKALNALAVAKRVLDKHTG